MGTLPQLAVVKGHQKQLIPQLLHRRLEDNVATSCADDTALIFNGKSSLFGRGRTRGAFVRKMRATSVVTSRLICMKIDLLVE
jgi:hypothetical protein